MTGHRDTAAMHCALTMQIPPRLESVAPASEAVIAAFAQTGSDSDRLRLLLAEVLNNIIEHGYGGAEGGPITIQVQPITHGLRLVLTDRGAPPPSELIAGAAEMPDPSALPDGGWGWPLLHALATAIRLERDETGNRLTLDFLPENGCGDR